MQQSESAAIDQDNWLSPSYGSPELTWRMSPQGRIESVNHAYHGYHPEDGYTRWRHLIAGDTPDALDAAIQAVLVRLRPVPVVETVARHPSTGEPIHFISTLTPVFNKRQLVAIDCSTRDVTLLRVVEQARERQLADLARIQYMLERIGEARSTRHVLRQIMHGAFDIVGGCMATLVLDRPGQQYCMYIPRDTATRLFLKWAAPQLSTVDEVQVVPLPAAMQPGHEPQWVALLPLHLGGHRIGLLTLSSAVGADRLTRQAGEVMFAVEHLAALADDQPSPATARRDAGRHWRWLLVSGSQGKLHILSDGELQDAICRSRQDATVDASVSIDGTAALPAARRLVEKLARQGGCNEDQVADLAICATEAATNVLVHGDQGVLQVCLLPDRLQVWIEDRGQGVDLLQLTRSTLLGAYSSRDSLGLGFHLMLELNDRVLVNTRPDGTTLILESLIRP